MIRDQAVPALLGAVSIVVGVPLACRRVPRNRWYGVRIPATLADDHVWYEANAVTGRDLTLVGVLALVLALLLPAYARICLGLLAAGSLVAALRGVRLANRLLKQRRSASARDVPSS